MASADHSHPQIDATVASILDRTAKTSQSRSPSPSLSDDSLDDLLSDPTTSALRAARLQQLKDEQSRLNTLRTTGHGAFALLDEKPAMDAVNASSHAALLFTHPDFPICAGMLRAMKELSELHVEARFVGVNAEDAKWLAGKMGVRVLPVIVGFIGGKEVGRLTGWDGVRGGEKGGSVGVEEVLLDWNVLARTKVEESRGGNPKDNMGGKLRSGKIGREEVDDDDWEWD